MHGKCPSHTSQIEECCPFVELQNSIAYVQKLKGLSCRLLCFSIWSVAKITVTPLYGKKFCVNLIWKWNILSKYWFQVGMQVQPDNWSFVVSHFLFFDFLLKFHDCKFNIAFAFQYNFNPCLSVNQIDKEFDKLEKKSPKLPPFSHVTCVLSKSNMD